MDGFRQCSRSAVHGFTLIELVMVIVLTGIIAVVASRFIAQPVEGYMAVSRRAALVDLADTALHRITRELRLALPNSVRVSASQLAVEFLRVRTGARYRAEDTDNLDFTLATDSFDVIGSLADAGSIVSDPAADVMSCVNGNVDCLVVYNTGQWGADAYAQDNIAGIRSASATAVSFNRPTPFPLASPGQRFYVTDTPVTYLCDPIGGTVRRYSGYALSASQSNVDTHAELIAAGASVQLLVDKVTSCAFSYQAGTATRGGLATLALVMSQGGERVSLLQQVHVSNLP